MAIRDQFPLRLLINGEDCTFEIPEGFSFANSDPGGFESASFPIPRDMPQLKRGDPVRLTCGLATAWEGRVKEAQRSLGAKTLVQCEGNAAILKENALAEILVDRDLTKWSSATLRRQKLLAEAGYNVGSSSVGLDPVASAPALVEAITGPWSAAVHPIIEAWYDAHGLPIGFLYYQYAAGPNLSLADPQWGETAALYDQDGAGGGGETSDSGGNLGGKASNAAYVQASKATRKFAALQFVYGAVASESHLEFSTYWRNLAVYGNSFINFMQALLGKAGIVGRGSDPVGFYASDFARFAISKCPGVTAGVIEDASFLVVPHAAYPSPVPIEQIIADSAKLAGWHWGVWETRSYLTGAQTPRVDFRQGPAAGEPTAWCWRRECEALDIRENIENLYNSALVTYSEPSGEERSVEVKLANPALDAVGLKRQVVLSLGVGSAEAAEAWGLVQLRLLADQARMTGSATIVEPIHEMSGALKPAFLLRSGLDRLRIPDLPCSDVWGAHNDLPITRVECTGSESGLTTSIEFGNGINLIETLAAQEQANLTAAG